jgi:hypothetical protein
MITEPKKPHISPTQLESYCRCGEAYRRRYIEGEVIPPGIALITGKGVDSAATWNFSQKIDTHRDLPVSEIVEAAATAFEEQIAGSYMLTPEEHSRGPKLVLAEAKDETVSLADLHAREQAPDYQPISVQREARIVLPKSTHDILNYIDLEDDAGRVVDIKTSRTKKQQSECNDSVQLTCYAAAYRILRGSDPSQVRLDVLVKNKTPMRQVLASTRGRSDYQALVNRVNAVLAGIKAGSFPPATPNAWWCSPRFCGYHSTCPYVNSEPVTVEISLPKQQADVEADQPAPEQSAPEPAPRRRRSKKSSTPVSNGATQ